MLNQVIADTLGRAEVLPAVADDVTAALEIAGRVALSRYLSVGDTVHLLQFVVRADGSAYNGWAPPARIVDRVTATYATFNGSRRDFAGTRCLGVGGFTAVYAAPWGSGDTEVMIYSDRPFWAGGSVHA